MALADYRLCDVCERKTFYDANLDYDFKNPERPCGLDRLGAWKVLCTECAKTHEVVVVNKVPLSAPVAGGES